MIRKLIKKWLAQMVLEIVAESKPTTSMEELQACLLETVMKDLKETELNSQNRLKLFSNH